MGKTWRDLKQIYLDRHAKPHKRTWKGDENRFKRHIPNGWNSRFVANITRHDVADLHGKIGVEHPYEANRLLALLSKVFELARSWGLLEETAPNPARGIQKFREEKRKRWLRHDELPALGEAIDQEPNV